MSRSTDNRISVVGKTSPGIIHSIKANKFIGETGSLLAVEEAESAFEPLIRGAFLDQRAIQDAFVQLSDVLIQHVEESSVNRFS